MGWAVANDDEEGELGRHMLEAVDGVCGWRVRREARLRDGRDGGLRHEREQRDGPDGLVATRAEDRVGEERGDAEVRRR